LAQQLQHLNIKDQFIGTWAQLTSKKIQGGIEMTKKVLTTLLIGGFILGLCSSVNAGKPTKGDPPVFNGNGYPSGPHYNLNIHGKKADYQCSPETWECTTVDEVVTKYASEGECITSCDVPDTCNRVYGGVINLPFDNVDENGEIIEGEAFRILIESGRKGPKGAPSITELQVTDSCAGFPVDDPDASFRLPKNSDGYAVYARITGKTGVDTRAIFTSPDFVYVEDENGNDLIELGQIVGTEITEINADSITIYRSTATKGNKVSKATDISTLFDYNGTVCYFDSYDPVDDFDYCLDYTEDSPQDVCSQVQLCCTATVDGVYSGCDLLENVGIDTTDNGIDDIDSCPPYVDINSLYTLPVEVDCRTYEDQWVFNIADFVGMLWEIGNNNAYNIKLRFYPLPLNQGE
jgi:hypothetical protein